MREEQVQGVVVGAVRFSDPKIVGALFDAWLSLLVLLIGETAQPYSWQNPRMYRATFHGVSDFRSQRAPIYLQESGPPIPKEKWHVGATISGDELYETREEPAAGLFEPLERGNTSVLKDPLLRGREHSFGWRHGEVARARFMSLQSDLLYMEFICSGDVSVEELTDDEARTEWTAQRDRYYADEPD